MGRQQIAGNYTNEVELPFFNSSFSFQNFTMSFKSPFTSSIPSFKIITLASLAAFFTATAAFSCDWLLRKVYIKAYVAGKGRKCINHSETTKKTYLLILHQPSAKFADEVVFMNKK